MKVNDSEPRYRAKDGLKGLILRKYKTVRLFSAKSGFTESMLCHILHGRRVIYPWTRSVFVNLLSIPEYEYDRYFEREVS